MLSTDSGAPAPSTEAPSSSGNILDDAYAAALATFEAQAPEQVEAAPAPAADAHAGDEPAAAPDKLSWADELARATPEQARLLKSLQADYTRKTMQVAEKQKELDRLLAEAKAKTAVAPPAQDASGDIDIFDPAALQAYIQQQVDARLQAAQAPVIEAQRRAEAESAYNAFVAAHSDIEDPAIAAEIDRQLDASEHMTLEQAYYIAKGKIGYRPAPAPVPAAAPAPAYNPRDGQRAAMQSVGRPGGPIPGGKVAPPSAMELRNMSLEEIVEASAAQMQR
jgi:hypothetical protein